MGGVQAHAARLISLFVNSALYGILLTTFVPCIQSLLFSASQRFQLKPRHEIKIPIIVATILMFLVSTFAAILALQNVFDAFIDYDGPGGALEFYTSTTIDRGWKHWFLAVEDAVQVILGDGLLIYRCYVLYDKSWRAIIAPGVTWTALTIVSLTSAYRESALPVGKRLNDASMLPLLTTTLILTFATSIITTYLIIRRLVMFQGRAGQYGAIRPHILSRVAQIFFESGLIYTLCVIASLAVYLSRSNLQYVASLAMIHIVPITTNLLMVRVERMKRSEPLFKATDPPSVSKEFKANSKSDDAV
ncbi:hypothetical protein C8R43DRAFT_554623 [Mycena crocata]|nr:hypothetical protein C8R43DRAFT_554623 [Mycena crocata]